MQHDTATSTPPHGTQLRSILPLVLGLFLAGFLLVVAFGNRQTNFEDLAGGSLGSSIYATHLGDPIHCKGLADSADCVAGAHRRGRPSQALWLGNSQVHTIMQLESGEQTAPLTLFRRLEPRQIDLLTFTQPNANLQEHYVLFEYLRQQIRLDTLILAVVFDDLRETGLRADIEPALAIPDVRAELERSDVGKQLLEGADQRELAGGDLAGLNDTLQEHSERWLNRRLDENFALWRLRPEARGSLFHRLYRLRNSALGITPQTRRRTIRGRYRANMNALQALLGSAHEAGIHVLVYVVPLRSDVAIPYDREEYRRFKLDLADAAQIHDARFVDLEALVPPELWGEKLSTSLDGQAEIDFMHFRGAGHTLLARELDELLADPVREGDR
jgi:hypothetical protein